MEPNRKEEAQRGRFKIALVRLYLTGYVFGGISDSVQIIKLRATADAPSQAFLIYAIQTK